MHAVDILSQNIRRHTREVGRKGGKFWQNRGKVDAHDVPRPPPHVHRALNYFQFYFCTPVSRTST